MPKPNYTTCCDIVKRTDRVASSKLMRLRAACGLNIIDASKMFSLDLGNYAEVEKGASGFKDWRGVMEMMCILSGKSLDLIDRF